MSSAKLRGGYYTPSLITETLAAWAIQTSTDHVLEPSGGDGAFVLPVARRLSTAGRLDVIELDEDEAKKIESHQFPQVAVSVGNAFEIYDTSLDGSYDAVIGNPPFIRYQLWPESHRRSAFHLMRKAGLSPNRLANAWVAFVVLATRALRQQGRLAMVLPAELLQVSYAADIREFLTLHFSELWVVTFRHLVFQNIQQYTVLLLGVRGSGPARIALVELDDLDDLAGWQPTPAPPTQIDLQHAHEKWTRYYLTDKELALVRDIETAPEFQRLDNLVSVNVGIVTGQNDFFVMRPSDAVSWGVLEHCLPAVAHAAHLSGLRYTSSDWGQMALANQDCLLLHVGAVQRDRLPDATLAYIEHGERLGHHRNFKCRVRGPMWWNIPSVHLSGGFMPAQIHLGPKIVVNETYAYCTDALHRLFVQPDTDLEQLAAVFTNSATFVFAELLGRSYGGGILQLLPTEAARLPVPKTHASLSLDELDVLVRQDGVESVLDTVDRSVLRDTGLAERDIRTLRDIWQKLSERRRGRNRKPAGRATALSNPSWTAT